MKIEMVAIDSLTPHPRNYRKHPDDQIEHIMASMKSAGFYRNIVIANDGTILAGHGVVEASRKMGIKEVPVHRVEFAPNDPQAMKILTGDNEMSRLGEVDDRMLTDILREINQGGDLLGTGFDPMMLANLAFITRPESELKDFDAAKEWVGLPVYQEGDTANGSSLSLTITFKTESDREGFIKEKQLQIIRKSGRIWSTEWPFEGRKDAAAVKFQ